MAGWLLPTMLFWCQSIPHHLPAARNTAPNPTKYHHEIATTFQVSYRRRPPSEHGDPHAMRPVPFPAYHAPSIPCKSPGSRCRTEGSNRSSMHQGHLLARIREMPVKRMRDRRQRMFGKDARLPQPMLPPWSVLVLIHICIFWFQPVRIASHCFGSLTIQSLRLQNEAYLMC
jgi:hypothetical protein